MRQRRTKEEQIELGRKIVEMKRENVKEAVICDQLNISSGTLWKLKKAYLESIEEKPPADLVSMVGDEFNGHEQVTVALFNPHEDAEDFNQLTITTTIKSGLPAEERKAAINAAIAKEKLIKWVEL